MSPSGGCMKCSVLVADQKIFKMNYPRSVCVSFAHIVYHPGNILTLATRKQEKLSQKILTNISVVNVNPARQHKEPNCK